MPDRPGRHLGLFLVDYVTRLAIAERLRGHVATYVAVASWQDSFWWAVVTVTAVGYRDHYSVTGEGWLFAAGLMLCGIALLGVVTAVLLSDGVGEDGEGPWRHRR